MHRYIQRAMDPRHFFAELKRRNVYKVAVAYFVGGWALAQGLAQVLPVFAVPIWVIQLLSCSSYWVCRLRSVWPGRSS